MTIAIAPSGAPAETTRLEVFVRSLAPTTGRARQERVLERARELEASGAVEEFELHVSGDRVGPSTGAADTEPGSRLLSRYHAFQQWASVRDRELVGFERRPVPAGVADGRSDGEPAGTGIRFPRLALAEYAGDRLAFVAPSEDGDGVSVEDRLAKL